MSDHYEQRWRLEAHVCRHAHGKRMHHETEPFTYLVYTLLLLTIRLPVCGIQGSVHCVSKIEEARRSSLDTYHPELARSCVLNNELSCNSFQMTRYLFYSQCTK